MKGLGPVGYKFLGRFFAHVGSHSITERGRPLPDPLTRTEFDVLVLFLSRPRQVVGRSDFEGFKGTNRHKRALDDYVSKINKKLSWPSRSFLQPYRGIGYKLSLDVLPVFEADANEADTLHRIAVHHFGRHTLQSMRTAVRLAEEALATVAPPRMSDAVANLAYLRLNLCQPMYAAELPDQVIPRVRSEMNTLLQSTPNFGRAFGVLGHIALFENDWADCEQYLGKALQLNPNDTAARLTNAHLLLGMGRRIEGLEVIREAVRIDRTDQIMVASEAWITWMAGDQDHAQELITEVLKRFPELPPARLIAGWIHESRGDYATALEQFSEALRLEESPICFAALGHFYGVTGNRTEARKMLASIRELQVSGKTKYISAYCEALVFAGLGDNKKCSDSLYVASQQHCKWLVHLNVNPHWSVVKDSESFRKLRRKVRIPE